MKLAMEVICCTRFDIIIILLTILNLGRYVESAISGASSFSRGILATDGFTTTWNLSSNYFANPFDRPRIPRQLTGDPEEVPSLAGEPKDQWLCETGKKYCAYRSSKRKNWLDASESCIAVGGTLPSLSANLRELSTNFSGNEELFTEDANVTIWTSVYWEDGTWHEFNDYAYSPESLSSTHLEGYIAKGKYCSSLGYPLGTMLPYKCNITLPFLCFTEQNMFKEKQRELRLPLKQVIDIKFQKIAGPDLGTEVLHCAPNFQYAYDNLEDRPFNVVWILDGAYFPEEGIKHGDHSTTLTVPHEHFTKYACEVRYLGSFYGNRSQEIEVATPSRGKLGFSIRIHDAASPSSSLYYDQPIKELIEALNNDPRAFKLSQIGESLYRINGPELYITDYMLSDTFQGRELKDMINFEEQIELLNALLSGTSINQPFPFQANTLNAIKYFENLTRNGTLVGVQFFAADRCPLEKSASYFWVGGVGQIVQPSLTGEKPAEICLDENNYPVTRTCSGSLFSGAQWLEPFSEKQNCSSATNNPTGTFCRAGYSRTTLGEENGDYCVKQVPSRPWNDAMEACFGGDIVTFNRELSLLNDYHPTLLIHTIEFFTMGKTSLVGNLLWLPSRRRVPSGPLYPYMVPPGVSQRSNYAAYSDWEVSLPGNAGSASKKLSYVDLDPGKLCLAWSVKDRTLTTRSCSERHPTLCIGRGHPVGSRNKYEFDEILSLYVPECRAFDYVVIDAFGGNSCQKLIQASTADLNVSSRFTWEEARMKCQQLHEYATLAIPARYLRSADTWKRFYNDARGSILKETWFGLRRSGGRSNTSCRLLTSTNQCAGPIHDFSSNTDFLNGDYVSSLLNVPLDDFEPQMRDDTLTLRSPETRLSQAMCQVNAKLPLLAETPVTYHLKLAWKYSTGNTLKLYLTREGRLLNGFDWEKILQHEWRLIRQGLFCFGDGVLIDLPDVGQNEVVEMEFEFPSHVTSFYCESRTSTAIFLRSNTLLWRQARLTFVVTLRVLRLPIVPETGILRSEDLQFNTDFAWSKGAKERIDDTDLSRITKSEFAEQFEPSKVRNEHLRRSSSFEMELGSKEKRKYTVLDIKYSRVGVDSKNYEKLLMRCHVFLHSTADNLTTAIMQLRDDMGSLEILQPYDPEEPRYMVTCLEEVERRPFGILTWIETPLDRTTFSREGCVFEGGSLVQRTCIGDIYYGAYWGPTQACNAEGQLVNLPSKFICASPSNTTSLLLRVNKTQENATSTLAELQQVTSQWFNPIIADVQLTALIFSNASREETLFSNTNVEQTAIIIQQVLNVNTDTLANAQRFLNVSTNFLMGIEEILTSTISSKSTLTSSALGANTVELTGSSPFLFTANSSNLGELNDTVANTRIIRSASPDVTDYHQHDASVVLDGSSLMVNRMHASQIAFVYHPSIRLADAAVAARKTFAKIYSPNPGDGDRDLLQTAEHTANSAMVQVAVKGGHVYNLPEPVNIYFRPFRAVNTSNSSIRVVCAFWNPEVNNGHGGWSTQGCTYQGNVSGLDHCQCNHLSSFVAFIAYENYEPSSHDSILDTLTTIGCALSLLGCIGVIATYALFPKWRQPKPKYYGHYVIFNLSIALAMLLSTFLGGFNQTSDGPTCLFVAAFLHYLTLVVFFWMLVEAYCHYSLFVRVLGFVTSYFMLKAFLFAWVLPLVPVIAVVVLDRHIYYHNVDNKFCWLKPLGFNSAILPFASLIGLINLSLYIFIIVKIGCSKSIIRSTQSKRSFTPYTTIVMFFVMGLSWIFGLLSFGHARIVFSYLFCIFNSLQGFAIFIHFILRGAWAQDEWQNFIQGKSNREIARNKILEEAKLRKAAAVPPCCATSETSLSTSTCTVHSIIIGEFKTRQRQQDYSTCETPNL